MKVCYITMQFPVPSETFAASDVRMLKERGIDVSVYALRGMHRDYDSMVQQRELGGVDICSVGFLRAVAGFFYALAHPVSLFFLLAFLVREDLNKVRYFLKMLLLVPSSFYIFKQLKKKNPDVVHLFWGHYPSLVGYLVLIKMPNVKLTVFLGAYDLECKLGVSVCVANRAYGVFTHAKTNLKELEKIGIHNPAIHVAYRGVDVARLSSIITKGKPRESHSWLSAGRLLPSKGFDAVIELFFFASQLYGKAVLTVAGDGPERDSLLVLAKKLGVADKVKLAGHLSHEELVGLMAGSEFFFLFSNKTGERLPNVIKEAMLSGCICFTTPTPGINELIEHGVTGFIVDHNNSKQCLGLIKGLGLEARTEIRLAASRCVLEKFDAKKNMNVYVSVWDGA